MRRPLLLFAALALALPGAARAQPVDSAAAGVLDGAFWKRQGLEQILPAWTRQAADSAHGAFFAELSRDWTPDRSARKYPGMIGRHVFSYAAAYLMSGREKHRQRAAETVDFMISRGWDERYGGWYNALTRTGAVADSSKDLFMQIYAATGLALYYAATRSERALRYLRRTDRLIQEHAWDPEHGGYVRSLRRNLSVKEPVKDFSPQLAPVSGYLLYLYRATGEQRYRERAERLLNLALSKMRDPKTGWLRERYARDWQFLPADRKNDWVNVGHNIEVVWMLLRLHLLNENPRYERVALELSRKLAEHAFREETGAWLHRLKPGDPSAHPEETPWWVQAYGNFLQLYLYHATGDEAALRRFRKGARFWNDHFVDERYGGTVLFTTLEGEVTNGAKGVRTKTSYHAMEHALLGYLLTRWWIQGEPAPLHFRVADPAPGDTLRAAVVGNDALRLRQATINGTDATPAPGEPLAVPLPDRGPARVTATLAPGAAPTEKATRAPADSLFDLVLYGRGLASDRRVFLRTNPGFGEAWKQVGPPASRRDPSGWGAVVVRGLSRERFLGQDFRENYLALKVASPARAGAARLAAVYAVPHDARNTTERLAEAIRERPGIVRRRSLASYVRPRAARLDGGGAPFVEKIEAPVRYRRPGVAEVAWLEVLFSE
jgi:mannobiose 2-epimerase